MRREVAQLWVDALESGEFEQGKSALEGIDRAGKSTFCCLGVLCQVAIREGVAIERNDPTSGLDESELAALFDDLGGEQAEAYYHDPAGTDGSTSWLPQLVVAWAGLASGDNNPRVATAMTASTANDERGWSFADIAAGVRQMYLTD